MRTTPGSGPFSAQVSAAELPASDIPALNVCAGTARKIEKIAQRNKVRHEAALPLLFLPRELRKIKDAEIAVRQKAFSLGVSLDSRG